jgi:hypothetical protein
VKLGLRDPAESMVMLDLNDIALPREGDGGGDSPVGDTGPVENGTRVASGGYRVTVDGRSYDYITPGHRVALGLPAFKEYSIGLKPEGAPQFDVDSVRRKVTLYPGNVVNLRFEAQRVISLFGQILAEDGKPLAQARIEAGTDYAVADDRGYFTITAPLSSRITIRRSDGRACTQRAISSLIDSKTPSLLYRFGKVRCAPAEGAHSQDIPKPVSGAPVQNALPRTKASRNDIRVDASQPDLAPPSATPASPLALMLAKEFLRQLNAA